MKVKNLLFFALITAFILLIPLVAMQFTAEVNWTGSDFVFAGMLLFGSGVAYEFATRNMKNRNYRIVVGLIILVVLALVWGASATGA